MKWTTLGLFINFLTPLFPPSFGAVRSIDDIIHSSMGQSALDRIRPQFELAGIDFPPSQLTLLVTKNTYNLEVWATDNNSPYRYILNYRILGSSGQLGPKLREGDYQIPEGVYQISELNPNSAFHLSMKINYPNNFDQLVATQDRRSNIGSNIFIHGGQVSTGCIAIGNRAIEELFVTVQAMGENQITVAIAPKDPRLYELNVTSALPSWTAILYRHLFQVFDQYHYLDVVKATPHKKT